MFAVWMTTLPEQRYRLPWGCLMTNFLVEKLQTFISTIKRMRGQVRFQRQLAQYPAWNREEVTRYGQFQQQEVAGSDDETSPFKPVEYLESGLLNETYPFGFYNSFDQEAASRSPNPDAALKLLILIRIISEDAYNDLWRRGIEAELWEIIITTDTIQQGSEYGQVFLTPNTVALLRSLARRAQGWWVWNDSKWGGVFVPAGEVEAVVGWVSRYITK